MADLLDLISDCMRDNRQIREVNGEITIGGQCYAKDLETSFPIKQVKKKRKDAQDRSHYKLGEVLFFLEHSLLPHSEYVKKAEEHNIMHVWHPDRKALLIRIFGNPKFTRVLQIAKTSGDTANEQLSRVQVAAVENASKTPRVETIAGINDKEKPRIRTYSRKRSLNEMLPSLRRRSLENENHFFCMDSSSPKGNTLDELDLIRNEILSLERSLESISTFLKDYLGVTSEEVKLLQDGICNPLELSDMAFHIKKRNFQELMLSCDDTCSKVNMSTAKFCYKAVKHPLRGWEMTKLELSSALSGLSDFNSISNVEDDHSAAVEECIDKVSIQLKRSFSLIISQMREFNKPPKTLQESDAFCDKVTQDCLQDAVDSFREMFRSLLSLQNNSQMETLDKWVSASRTELKKLFESLAMTLKSLRDIPTTHRHPPLTLFHLPEPTLSLALNPGKITHSVVLEMYLRIGLAELRRIVMSLMGYVPKASGLLPTSEDLDCNAMKWQVAQDDLEHLPDKISLENSSTLASLKEEQPHDSLIIPHNQEISDQSQGYSDQLEHLREIFEPKPSTSAAAPSVSSPYVPTITSGVLSCRNGKFRRSVNRNSPYQTRRSSESDCFQYKKFKVSLGNTLVSSFKKQIQEKIQASNSQSQYTWK